MKKVLLTLFAALAMAMPANAQHHTSLFGIAEQRRIDQLLKQLADAQAAQVAALNAQLAANQAAQNQLLIAFLSQRQQAPAPVAPVPQAAPPISYHIYIPGAPKMDPSPGTPKLDPAPGVPQLNPNPGIPPFNPNPGTPQIIINPGAPKLNPNPGAPIPFNPSPGQPGPGTSAIPNYQSYSGNRLPVIAPPTDRPPAISVIRSWQSR